MDNGPGANLDRFTEANIAALAASGAPADLVRAGTAFFDNFLAREGMCNVIPEPATFMLAAFGLSFVACGRTAATTGWCLNAVELAGQPLQVAIKLQGWSEQAAQSAWQRIDSSMTVLRLQSVLVVALAVAGAWDTAQAQDLPVATRGTVKVRSRVFNPFEIGQSRLTVNPFGVFTVAESSPFSVPTVSPTSPAVTSSSSAPASSASTSTPVVATGDPPSGSLDSGFATSTAVRPPFRPPERSPWRPPPRPPFLPP